MKQYAMMEKRGAKAAFGLFLFAMLLLARDTLITSCLLGFTKSQFLMLGLICLFALGFLAVNRGAWKQILCDRRMLLIAVSTVLLLVPMVVKRDWQMMYFSILICLFFAVFLSYFTTVREVAKYYVVMLTGLGLYSVLVSNALKYMVLAGWFSVPVFYNSSGWEFQNFGLGFAVSWTYWHRNFGIFREPGVYQFFILMALYLNNYFVSWNKQRSLWVVNGILIVTMLSTFAVGGIIELGLFAVFLYFDKQWHKNKWGKIAGISLTIAMIAFFIHVVIMVRKPGSEATVYYVFTDLYLRLFTNSDSLVDRLSAIFTNLKIFLDAPVFGNTIANVLHGTNHNTSSTLILYAVLGVLGGSLNVAAWIALAWEKRRNLLGNLVLMVILFMSFNTQNLVADVFFWLFPFMALTERGLPLIKIPERKG